MKEAGFLLGCKVTVRKHSKNCNRALLGAEICIIISLYMLLEFRRTGWCLGLIDLDFFLNNLIAK